MGSGASATMAIEWAFRDSNFKTCKTFDPKVTIPVGQIETWMELFYNANQDKKKIITECWHKALAKLKGDAGRWMRVIGPMTATICTLLDMEWSPTHPPQMEAERERRL